MQTDNFCVLKRIDNDTLSLKIKAITLCLMKLIDPNELSRYLNKLDDIEKALNEAERELSHLEGNKNRK